jgi:hypothetical protein
MSSFAVFASLKDAIKQHVGKDKAKEIKEDILKVRYLNGLVVKLEDPK